MKYIFEHPESMIKEVQMHKPNGALEVLLYQPDQADEKVISAFKTCMEQKGYDVMAGEDEHRPVLRISGFSSAQQALAIIADGGGVKGDVRVEGNDKDISPEVDKRRQFQRLALLGAGLTYAAGNTCTMLSGWNRGMENGGLEEIIQGGVWNIAAAGLIASATQTANTNMSYLYRDFEDFLHDSHLRIPSDVQHRLQEHAADHSLGSKALELALVHGTELNNITKIAGAAMMLKAGLSGEGNPYKVAGALTLATGMTLGITLPQPDHNTYESSQLGSVVGQSVDTEANGHAAGRDIPNPTEQKGFIGSVIDKMNSNPLFYSGALALVKSAINTVGVEKIDKERKAAYLDPENGKYYKKKVEYENRLEALAQEGFTDSIQQQYTEIGEGLKELERKKSYYDSGERAGAYISLAEKFYFVANSLYMCSSKKNGADLVQSGGINSIMEMAANVIMQYEPEVREGVTQRIATFLGNHHYVHFGIDDVVTMINAKVDALDKSAWLGKAENNIVPFERAKVVDAVSPAVLALTSDESCRLSAAKPVSIITDTQYADVNRMVQAGDKEKYAGNVPVFH